MYNMDNLIISITDEFRVLLLYNIREQLMLKNIMLGCYINIIISVIELMIADSFIEI
jgi:hypothetical protein